MWCRRGVDLEVQVTAGGVPELPDLADPVSGGHVLAVVDVDALHVRIPGGQPTGADADLDEPAARPGLVGADDDAAAGGGEHRGAAGHRQVGAGVPVNPVGSGAAPVALVEIPEAGRQREHHSPGRTGRTGHIGSGGQSNGSSAACTTPPPPPAPLALVVVAVARTARATGSSSAYAAGYAEAWTRCAATVSGIVSQPATWLSA